ncbi:putative odorant receptor 83c [Sabethes cyaneus]|uniref:putative odorant receptor 83c n=1 Tax=Sabethes cyaneus TaxID=53552 RepID=UPI00237E2C28|nr:putative odorant receptor 83c [Sabethes cyaneus]
MSTVEAYNDILAPITFLSKIIGVEIWNVESIFSPMSYFTMINMVLYNLCACYTVRKYSDDPLKMLQIVVLFGIASQLIYKFFMAIEKKASLRALFDETKENIYCAFEKGTRKEKAAIEKTSRYLSIGWKILSVLYISSLFVFAIWPVYVYYTKNELVPLFFYEIPYVNIDEKTGYTLTMLFHVDIYILGLVGAVLADYGFIFVVFHSMLFVDLLVMNLTQLDDMLISENREANLNAIAEQWKICMKYHQITTEFLNTIEAVFGLSCLVQVFSCIFTMCDSMVILVLTDWYAAYCFLLVVFFELSIYFILGNLVELKIESLYENVTSLSWYRLSLSQQKEFLFVMARQQRPMILTIFGFAPLNFESYMTVLRALYQFFIIILQSLA